MKAATEITMDEAGRLVIPKPIREQAGLRPGVPLAISCEEGRIEIEPAPRAVKLVRKGSFRVAVPIEPLEPLTAETVERVRDELRGRNGG
jgi:AbrB family looped-hinge helix DNA binding protein